MISSISKQDSCARIVSYIAGDFTNITRWRYEEHNNLGVTQSVIPCGVGTHNTQHSTKQQGYSLNHYPVFVVISLLCIVFIVDLYLILSKTKLTKAI